MKILTRWIFADLWHSMYGKPFAHKVKVFWLTAWQKHPEVMASNVLSAFGISLFAFTVFKAGFKDKKHKYLQDPIVYRPNDPRVAKIEKTSIWD